MLPALVSTLVVTTSVTAQPVTETADVVENEPIVSMGGTPTLRAEEATLTRFEDRLVFEVRMDTPTPGSYVYPPDPAPPAPPIIAASPEVFTTWAFVFNHPEQCISEADRPTCGFEDFNDSVRAGVYGIAGHLTAIDHEGGAFMLDRDSDGQMVFRAEIVVGDTQRSDLPPDATTYPLENPLRAEIHFVIAPHGQFDPATIATELYAPRGRPGCGCWWVAFFSADEDQG